MSKEVGAGGRSDIFLDSAIYYCGFMVVALQCLEEGGLKIPKRIYVCETWNKSGRG